MRSKLTLAEKQDAMRRRQEERQIMEQNELCTCGRLTAKVHCPHCGSYVVTAFARRHDSRTLPNGQVVLLNVYRCRRCGSTFNDDDWKLRCTALAPFVGRPSKIDTVAPIQFDGETDERIPDHMKAALEIIKKQRGIT